MKQLMFIQPGRVEWRDVPEPKLESAGDALVRPLAVAACDLDASIIRGQVQVPGPFSLGHECIAEVTAVGPEVKTVQVGDRVVVPFQISCGACPACRRGNTANCTGVEPRRAMFGLGTIAGKDWGGALSDAMRVPHADAMLVPLPAGVDPVAVASLSDNLVDAWRTVAPPLAANPGASVLIVGGGAVSIAVYAVAIARALGADVTYVDASEERLELARSFGATVVARPGRRQGRHPITVDASTSKDGLHLAIRSTAPGGLCTSVGIYFQNELPLPLLEMYTDGITFVTSRVDSRPTIPRVLELVTSGRLHPERITTRVVPFTDAAEALNAPFTKLVLVPSA
jgi:threonine dehydrogenase-like Zn-dependent dehydrogenase